MSKLGFVIRRLGDMNYKNMLSKVKQAKSECKKPSFIIFLDMVYCGFRYQAGYMDYVLFRMFEKTRAQRRTILTRGKNNMYVSALNNKEKCRILEDKPEFHKVYSKFTRRDFLDLQHCKYSEFEEFLTKHPEFVVKPPDGSHGDGVRKLKTQEISDKKTLFEELLANNQTLCEELVYQHEGMLKINPGSVNTIRTVTMIKDGEPVAVTALLRIGGAGSAVDNFNNGGMVVPVDVRTGAVTLPAVDKSGRVYTHHPATGTPIAGCVIPLWEECLELVKHAALVLPDVRYVGWDVAVTPDGPLLIEGNSYPGHDIYGLTPHSPDGMGVLPVFERVIAISDL